MGFLRHNITTIAYKEIHQYSVYDQSKFSQLLIGHYNIRVPRKVHILLEVAKTNNFSITKGGKN